MIATGLAGGPTGQRLIEELAEEAILHDVTPIAAESRINLAVVDPTSGEQTEINERGPEVSPGEIDAFLDRLDYLARGASICVLAGSLPPGVDSTSTPASSASCASAGSSSSSTPMESRCEPGSAPGRRRSPPTCSRPRSWSDTSSRDPGDLASGLAELLDLGAGEAIVTSSEGCVAAVGEPSRRSFYEVRTEPVEPIATVGSGDAFVAGYVAALYDGAAASDCLAYGVACGAESTQHFGAGTVDPEQVERILDQVEVRALEVPAGV